MRWSDEPYIRVYTRDTVEWDMLPWESRALWPLLLRKVDRAGLLELGKHGARGLASLVKLPVHVVEVGLAGLLDDGCVELRGTVLVVPNFHEAQTAAQSDAQRKREERARAVANARLVELTTRDESQNVTAPSEFVTPPSQNVTESHHLSRPVTNGHSDLSSSDLSSISHTHAREDASPPGLSHPRARVDVRKLTQAWTRITGVIAHNGIAQLAQLVEDTAASKTPPIPPDEYAERAITAFVEWVNGIENERRRPQKSPQKLIDNFERIQEIVDGTRAPVPPDEPPPKGRASSGTGDIRQQPPSLDDVLAKSRRRSG
jgi:hypothetical protein